MSPLMTEQSLTKLHGRGVYYPGDWGLASFCPYKFVDADNPDGAAYLAFCDQLLATSHKTRVLTNFAGICQTFFTVSTPDTADALEAGIRSGFIQRLLDIPSIAGLHTRQLYITELCEYLTRHLWTKALLTGEQPYAVQELFVQTLVNELLCRRESWKAEVKARCPVTAEQLTEIVWHPRRVARHLAAVDGDEAAETHFFNAWTHESVGCGAGAVVLQGTT